MLQTQHVPAASWDKGGQRKRAEGPWHPGTSVSLPQPAIVDEGTVGAVLPSSHPAHSALRTLGWRGRQEGMALDKAETWQGAKTCPRKSGPGLFTLAERAQWLTTSCRAKAKERASITAMRAAID